MEALVDRENRSGLAAKRSDRLALAPAAAAIGYPFLLAAFHLVVGPPGATPSLPGIAGAILVLSAAFAVPALGIALACRPMSTPGSRRLAYASVLSPTLYVFVGVVQALVRSPVPDELVWCAIWLGIAAWSRYADAQVLPSVRAIAPRRLLHGITAAVLCLYVLFHVGNHLFGLAGPDAHAAVMEIGRKVYRAPLLEPLLVAALLLQVATGLGLAWRWSAAASDFPRTFQVASGLYLSAFILGHMNAVFIYARTYLHIQTDWAFATGAPTGLIYDAWNIRLVPHYALGVFFVLSHLASGLRAVLVAHGFGRRAADRLWLLCAATSAVISSAVIAGMCGVRIGMLVAPGPWG